MLGKKSFLSRVESPTKVVARVIFWICFFGVLSCLIVFSRHNRSAGCVICGMTRQEIRYECMGVQYWSKTIHDSKTSEIYNTLIAVPHQHQWAEMGYSSGHGTIWGGEAVGCGGKLDPHIRLVGLSLQLIQNGFMDYPLNFRRQFHSTLCKCASQKEFNQVLDRVEKDPSGWLREKTEGGKPLSHATTLTPTDSAHLQP